MMILQIIIMMKIILFQNKNEPFFYNLDDKIEKIEKKEINPLSIYDQKKEINCSNYLNKNCKILFSIKKK